TLDEVHAPAIEALILDAKFPVTRVECQSLRLRAGEGTLRTQREAPPGSPPANDPPHLADFRHRRRRPEREGLDLVAGLHPQVAKSSLALPGAESEAARGERMLSVVVPQDGLAIDADLEHRTREPHLEGDPAADRHRARDVLDGLEVVAVSRQEQTLALRVERD